MEKYYFDLVIVGGGVCGLWLKSTLSKQGFSCCLLEKEALGGTQSILSQGIIHKGIKYSLDNFIPTLANNLAKANLIWDEVLEGKSDLNLSKTKILAQQQLIWQQGGILSTILAKGAKKFLQSQLSSLTEKELPSWLKPKTNIFWLKERVLDSHSLLKNLAAQQENCYQFNCDNQNLSFKKEQNLIQLSLKNPAITICAKKIIFAAGKGNLALSEQFNCPQKLQLRPLKMLLVKHNYPLKIYGHCLGNSTKPLFTISSYPAKDKKMLWYLGGKIAEDGINLKLDKIIPMARKLLEQTIKVDLSSADWQAVDVERVEPRQKEALLPNQVYVKNFKNAVFCLPVKLVLTPLVALEVQKLLKNEKIYPEFKSKTIVKLKKASLKPAFWQN